MSSDTLRVAVIGLGFGKYHIKGYQACADVEVAAVCSRTPETAHHTARDYAIPEAVTDYRQLLDRPDIDAVSICTPVYLHKQMTLDALAAGKHVLCEKPLGLDSIEAQAMLDAAGRSGLVHMTNFGWRFNAPAFRMKALIDEGYLGTVYHINARYMMGYRADPQGAHSWRDRQAEGGFGVLGDMGVHLIDMARWWLGDFIRVCGMMRNLVPERPSGETGRMAPSELEDTCGFLAELSHGVHGVFHASRCALRTDYILIDVHGSSGALQFQFQRETMHASLKGGQGLQGDFKTLSMPAELADLSPQRHFTEAIRNNRPAEPGFAEGVFVQQIADAVVKSEAEEKWITVTT